MDIFDSRYFQINKNLLIAVGLWPYDNRKKYFFRTFFFVIILIFSVPQILSMIKNLSNLNRVLENAVFTVLLFCDILKLLTLGMAQEELKVMFDGIVDNWQIIVNAKEKEILCKYSEKGRRLTLAYSIFFIVNIVVFISGPLALFFMNKTKPQSEQWPYFYLLNGEYLTEDRDANYLKIYFWEFLTICLGMLTVIATDTTFVICVDHCLGLIAIVRHRIEMRDQLVSDDTSKFGDTSYDWLVKTIELHQRVLKFTDLIEASYSTCFFFMLSATLLVIPFSCVLITTNLDYPIQVLRYNVLFSGMAVHIFIFCWPGQQLINNSTGLFENAYLNEWYRSSLMTKKALKFFMMRCLKPCIITAGGLFIMNFENFLHIMKMAASYISVVGSLR